MYTYEEVYNSTLEYFNNNELATNVFINKYALKDNEGNFLEKTPDDMHRRLAKEFARVEKEKFKEPMGEEEIYSYLKNFERIIPQGSPMYGIGNKYKYVTLSNCYVLPAPHDSYLGINYLDTQIAQIAGRRGGIGWSMSTLRPKNTPVSNAAGSTTGVVSFMHRYSNTIREVCSHGRRGASLQALSVKHPEILDFIKCKNNETSITGSNISVQFTDDFMNAVKNKDKEFELKWPIDSNNPKITKKVNPQDIWNKFIDSTWNRAEPGAIFMDTIHSKSTSAVYPGFEEVAPNPCVVKGTLVNTPTGYKKVEDLSKGDEVYTTIGKELIDSIEYNIDTPTYKIEFSDGGEQIVTKNHQYHIFRRGIDVKKAELISVKDINIGDRVRVQQCKFDDQDYTNYKDGLQIGILLGDGCYTERQLKTGIIKIASNQEDVEYNKLIKEYAFNEFIFNQDDCNKTSKSMSMVMKCSLEQFSKFNLIPLYSHEKNVDITKITTLGMAIGVLDGLLATDGNVNLKSNHPQIRWDTSSKNLAYNIRRLLLYIGCHGFISESNSKGGKIDGRQINRNYTKYTVTISGSSVANYCLYTSLNKIHPEKFKLLQKACIDFRLTGNCWMAKVKSIEPYKNCETYDIYCKTSDTWITDGYVQRGCGEQFLPDFGCCRLIVINLYTYVKNKFSTDSYFDYESFKKDVKILQRLADDMVDLDIESIDRILEKIRNDPEPDYVKQIGIDLWTNIKNKSQRDRRTGCGIVGLADTLAALNLKYDSNDSLSTCDKIFKAFKLSSYESSVDMAEKIRPFPEYCYELDKSSKFIQDIKQEDEKLYNRMKKYGRRNMTLLTIAPTGSVSIVTQTSSGIEPVFMLEYKRRKKVNDENDKSKIDFVDKSDDKWSEFVVAHKGLQDWKDITGYTDIESSPYYNSCAHEIDYMKKIELQGIIQKHIDNSISVTTNLPKDITKEKISKLYLKAYEVGCKGFTIYRDGCRSGILVSNSEEKVFPEERPKELKCDVHHVTIKGQQYFILVGLLNEEPYEVFAGRNGFLPKKVKTGTIIRKRKGFYKAIFDDTDEELSPITASTDEMEEIVTRLTSGLLRVGSDIHFVVLQLERVGEKQTEMHSFAKSVARALKKYIPDGTKSGICPECGVESLVRQEGCKTCQSCGFSKCL